MRARLGCAVFGMLLPLGVAADWEMEPLGPPPAGYSQPNVSAINDRGQVVGTIFDSEGFGRVYVWDDGNWTILPTLGGFFMLPTGFNNQGTVVGWGLTGNFDVHGFVWERGEMEELGNEGFTTAAEGINNAGTVVGVYDDASGRVAALWEVSGRVTPLGSNLGGSVIPVAINARGQVVGTASVGTTQHAFLWDERGGIVDLGTLTGLHSRTTAINGSGKVAGYGETDELLDCNTAGTFCVYVWAPFSWEDGVMTRLPVLGGTFAQAEDINDDGVVVGTSETDQLLFCEEDRTGLTRCVYQGHAVVWLDGELIDLGQQGKRSYANGINNAWEIAGWAEGFGPVIWRPVEPVE